MRRAAPLALVLSFLLFAAGPASSQPRPGKFFLKGDIGYATHSLGDWNDYVGQVEGALQEFGLPADFKEFGGALAFGGEFGWQASRTVSLSLAVDRQSNTGDNSYVEPDVTVYMNEKVAVTSVTGRFAYWLPSVRGLFFGADAGVGFGSAKEEFSYRDFIHIPESFDRNGDWTGSALVAGVFGGYQYQFVNGVTAHAKVGYRYQNLGKLDGTTTLVDVESYSGPPTDLHGDPMDTDLSGLELKFGLGFVFGGGK